MEARGSYKQRKGESVEQKKFTVYVRDNKFSPSRATIVPGTHVSWVHAGKQNEVYSVADLSGDFQSPELKAGDTFTRKFELEGHYEYGCLACPFMLGTLSVSKNSQAGVRDSGELHRAQIAVPAAPPSRKRPAQASNGGSSLSARNGALIKIGNYQYRPSVLSIPVGTTVTWKASADLDPLMLRLEESSGLFEAYDQPSFTYSFEKPGIFHYANSIYPFMKGEVHVENPRKADTKSHTDKKPIQAKEDSERVNGKATRAPKGLSSVHTLDDDLVGGEEEGDNSEPLFKLSEATVATLIDAEVEEENFWRVTRLQVRSKGKSAAQYTATNGVCSAIEADKQSQLQTAEVPTSVGTQMDKAKERPMPGKDKPHSRMEIPQQRQRGETLLWSHQNQGETERKVSHRTPVRSELPRAPSWKEATQQAEEPESGFDPERATRFLSDRWELVKANKETCVHLVRAVPKLSNFSLREFLAKFGPASERDEREQDDGLLFLDDRSHGPTGHQGRTTERWSVKSSVNGRNKSKGQRSFKGPRSGHPPARSERPRYALAG